MIWLEVLTFLGLVGRVRQSCRALGKPIVRGGKRWYRQPDGRHTRWHGIGSRTEAELPSD